MDASKLVEILAAAGVTECLAMVRLADGSEHIIDSTQTRTTQCGLMYRLEKHVEALAIREVIERLKSQQKPLSPESKQ